MQNDVDGNLIFREYIPGDKDRVIEIMSQHVPAFFDQSEIADLDEYLENKIEKYFVAEINNQIVGGGGINFGDNKKTGIISWDFIDPKLQGQGIGQKLLRHRIDFLKSMAGIETIIVRTSQLAYGFYEKNGFVLKGTEKDFWAKGYDMYYMKYES